VNGLLLDSENLKTGRNFRRQMKGKGKEGDEDERVVKSERERERERELKGGTYIRK